MYLYHINISFNNIISQMGFIIYIIVTMTLITLLYKSCSYLKCYIKYIFFGLICGFMASAPIPLMLLNPRDSKNALIPAAGLRATSRFLGLTLSLEGKENIVKNSGCVVLINHQSMLDLIVLAVLWPEMDNCTVISKKEILYFQPFGLASWLWGTIFIDRVKKDDAQNAINKTGQTIRDRKARVLMFPEGTRNHGKELLKFKKGAFHLAIASKSPIQPVVVNKYTFLGKNRFDDGHIRIKILEPVSTEGYTKDNIQELMDKIYNIMSKNIDLISQDCESLEKKTI